MVEKIVDGESGAGVSQDFNDNVNNAETGTCFQCHTYRKISEFGKSSSKYVCNSCHDEFHDMLKKSGITFIEVPGRKVSSMGGNARTITDVYGIIGCDIEQGERFHLGGYTYPASEFDVARARSDMLSRQRQFVISNGDFVKLYCHSDKATPEQFIDWVKEIGDNFGQNYAVSIHRCGSNYWEFAGNLEQRSCSFHFRIFTEKQFDLIAGKLSDPYFKNIKVSKDKEMEAAK